MESRAIRGVLTLGGAVGMALVVLGLLNLVLPGCSDVANFDQSILCMGGLGEPAWKPPLVFLLVTLVTGTVIWESVE